MHAYDINFHESHSVNRAADLFTHSVTPAPITISVVYKSCMNILDGLRGYRAMQREHCRYPQSRPYSSSFSCNKLASERERFHIYRGTAYLIMEGQKFKVNRSRQAPQNARQTSNARDRMWIRMEHEPTPLNVAPGFEYS